MAAVHLPRWAIPFTAPATYKCAFGGRASSKTWTVAHILAASAAQKKMRGMCCRAFGTSIKASAKLALEAAIVHLGLSSHYSVYEYSIRGANGSYFGFTGLERNREEIRGWEDLDFVWIEEAQAMTESTARILIPTIRKPGHEFWFTWNPKERTDWVWRRFIVNPRPGDVIAKVNWRDNPWFPAETNEERLYDMRTNPDMYAHIWEGEPDDQGGEKKVLPFYLLEKCIEAYRQGKWSGQGIKEIGLDIADSGENFNALVGKRGACIVHAEKWRSNILGETARRADRIARESGTARLFYDVQGVGAGVRSYFAEMTERPYSTRPEMFGGKVKGGDVRYNYRVSNDEFFARRNAQLGWALRVRAMKTERLLNGEEVDPDECLFISDKIPRLEEFLAQLSQPAWRESMTGKTELIKRDEEEASPDLYDAAVLAFSQDSVRGLKYR